MIKTVGIIGVGAMGGPMARRISAAGFDVLACDRDADLLATFAADGIRTTQDAADCAATDLVLVLVATVAQARDVVLGDNGIVSGLAEGDRPVVGLMSTVGPDAVKDIDRELNGTSAVLVDCPISGGAVRAANGTLAMMAAGPGELIDEIKPVLLALGKEVLRCGDVGAAQTIKVLNNVIGGVNTMMVAETYRIALEHGMSLTEITRVLDASTGRNWLSVDAGEVASSFAQFTEKRETWDSLVRIMHKDFDLARELIPGSGANPMVEHAMDALNHMGDETYENWRAVGGGREV